MCGAWVEVPHPLDERASCFNERGERVALAAGCDYERKQL